MRARMLEFYRPRVQTLTAQHRCIAPRECGPIPAVNGISEHGMPDMRHMHPYLMRSARLEPDIKLGKCLSVRAARKACAHGVVRDRLFSARHHRHPFAIDRMPCYRRVYRSLIVAEISDDYRRIYSPELVRRKLLCKEIMRLIGLCNEQKSARILIYTMNDTGTQHTADARQ